MLSTQQLMSNLCNISPSPSDQFAIAVPSFKSDAVFSTWAHAKMHLDPHGLTLLNDLFPVGYICIVIIYGDEAIYFPKHDE